MSKKKMKSSLGFGSGKPSIPTKSKSTKKTTEEIRKEIPKLFTERAIDGWGILVNGQPSAWFKNGVWCTKQQAIDYLLAAVEHRYWCFWEEGKQSKDGLQMTETVADQSSEAVDITKELLKEGVIKIVKVREIYG